MAKFYFFTLVSLLTVVYTNVYGMNRPMFLVIKKSNNPKNPQEFKQSNNQKNPQELLLKDFQDLVNTTDNNNVIHQDVKNIKQALKAIYYDPNYPQNQNNQMPLEYFIKRTDVVYFQQLCKDRTIWCSIYGQIKKLINTNQADNINIKAILEKVTSDVFIDEDIRRNMNLYPVAGQWDRWSNEARSILYYLEEVNKCSRPKIAQIINEYYDIPNNNKLTEGHIKNIIKKHSNDLHNHYKNNPIYSCTRSILVNIAEELGIIINGGIFPVAGQWDRWPDEARSILYYLKTNKEKYNLTHQQIADIISQYYDIHEQPTQKLSTKHICTLIRKYSDEFEKYSNYRRIIKNAEHLKDIIFKVTRKRVDEDFENTSDNSQPDMDSPINDNTNSSRSLYSTHSELQISHTDKRNTLQQESSGCNNDSYKESDKDNAIIEQVKEMLANSDY